MAKFEKGKPRAEGAGRKPGTPNKDKQLARDICAKHGIDLFEASLILAMKEKNEDVQLHKFLGLLPYTHAKLSSIDLGIDPENNKIRVVIEDYRSNAK